MANLNLRTMLLSAGAALAVALLAACGGDDDSDATATATTTGEPGTATASPTVPGQTPGGSPTAETPTEPPAEEIPFETPATIFSRNGGDQETAQLIDIRVGRNEGFDRVVFEFEGEEVPGFTVEYVDSISQCGSGEPVEYVGEALVSVILEPASGHTEGGEATVPPDVPTQGAAAIREVRGFCDFEAQVGYGISLSGARPFRVFELTEPARLVIDFSQ